MRTLSLTKPHLIVMVGIPGSGKTFFAEKFADSFNAPLVSFERLEEDLFGRSTRSSNDEQMIAQVASILLDELFKTRQSIIFDGISSQKNDRAVLAQIAVKAGYEPLFIWVQTESTSARQRATKLNPVHKISNNEFDEAVDAFNAPSPVEKLVVISGKHTYPSQLKNVLKRLIEPRAEAAKSQPVAKRPPTNGRNILIR